MPRFQMTLGDGIEKYMNQLKKLEEKTPGLCRRSVYAGGGVAVAGAKKAWLNLPLADFSFEKDLNKKSPYMPPKKQNFKKLKGVSVQQKLDLIHCTGISKHDTLPNEVNAEVGVDGYMENYKTNMYPNGVPALLFARALEKGTSFREACPVMKKAVREMRPKVIDAMDKQLNKDIQEIMR